MNTAQTMPDAAQALRCDRKRVLNKCLEIEVRWAVHASYGSPYGLT